MKGKSYSSEKGKFTLTLQPNWDQYDDGKENADAFYNVESWTGNFRISPINTKIDNEEYNEAIDHFIHNELTRHRGARKIRLAQYDCVHYKEDTKQDGEELTMFYWTFKKGDRVFICSLTVDKPKADDPSYNDTLDEVQGIIKSMKII